MISGRLFVISLILVGSSCISIKATDRISSIKLNIKGVDTLEIISINSGDNIYALKGKYNNDTLFVNFKRDFLGLRVMDNKIVLRKNLHYIQCGGQMWKIHRESIYPYLELVQN